MVCQGRPGGSRIVTMSAARSQSSKLLADLIAGSAGGELVEHDLRAGGDGRLPWTGARVRVDDRLDLGGIALAGHGPGVDVAHGAQVPGDASGGDAPGRVGVFVDDGDAARPRP